MIKMKLQSSTWLDTQQKHRDRYFKEWQCRQLKKRAFPQIQNFESRLKTLLDCMRSSSAGTKVVLNRPFFTKWSKYRVLDVESGHLEGYISFEIYTI